MKIDILKFYKSFSKKREKKSGVSEYNLYFYFLVSHYPQNYKIRILKYKNTAKINAWKERLRSKYDFVHIILTCEKRQRNKTAQENFPKKISC